VVFVPILSRRFVRNRGMAVAIVQSANGFARADGLLLDLGVSSLQLSARGRGFSFQEEAPLDMRMDPTLDRTAAHLVNELSEVELTDLLFRYGEEPQARRVARAILRRRPLVTTSELAGVVRVAIGRPGAAKAGHCGHRVGRHRELRPGQPRCRVLHDRRCWRGQPGHTSKPGQGHERPFEWGQSGEDPRGLARMAHAWSELPATSERFASADHPFARDLDVFGRGSVMQLVDATETRLGAERLAELPSLGAVSYTHLTLPNNQPV